MRMVLTVAPCDWVFAAKLRRRARASIRCGPPIRSVKIRSHACSTAASWPAGPGERGRDATAGPVHSARQVLLGHRFASGNSCPEEVTTRLALWASSKASVFFDAAAIITTPLLPDDFLGQLNPLWSTRMPCGRVEAVVAETRDCVTLWLRPGRGWPEHVPGQYVRVGVEIDGVRHWRTYSLTSVPRRRDGRIAITVKQIAGGLVSEHLVRHARQGMLLRLAPPTGGVRPPRRCRASAAVRHGRQRCDAGHGDAARARPAARAAFPTSRTCTSPRRLTTRSSAVISARSRAGTTATRCTSTTTTGDGRWDVAELDRRVPDWRERQTWACGPAGLLDALSERFERAGVSDRLHLERFRPVLAVGRPRRRRRPCPLPRQRQGGRDRRDDAAAGGRRAGGRAAAARVSHGHLQLLHRAPAVRRRARPAHGRRPARRRPDGAHLRLRGRRPDRDRPLTQDSSL